MSFNQKVAAATAVVVAMELTVGALTVVAIATFSIWWYC